MNILIVGLGLMGGSYAYRLMEKGYNVYGVDLNEKSIEYAINNNFIIDGDIDPTRFIPSTDIILIAIYPKALLSFLSKYNHLFKENMIITDLCGVKSSFILEAEKLAYPAIYCSHHPMAGREKIGIEYSKEVVFSGANYLITPTKNTPQHVVDKIYQMGVDLGFKRITVMDYEKHDRMIGFTSQLAHAIAVALVNSDKDSDTKNFIGDSYRDLTRIAMINESLWSELFLENKDHLLVHIENFEKELDKLKNALYDDDLKTLCDLFKSSTITRRGMEK